MKNDSVGPWGKEEYYINHLEANDEPLDNIIVYAFCHSRICPGYKFQNHRSSYFTINLVLKGNISSSGNKPQKSAGTISISDLKASEGSSSYVGKNEELERYFILIKSSPFAEELFLRMFKKELPSFVSVDIEKLAYYFEAMRDNLSNDANIDSSRLVGLFFGLVSEIQKQQNIPGYSSKMQKALSFINSHYTLKTLSRIDIASHVKVSIRSLSSLFIDQAQTTVTKYINSLRLGKVRQMLLYSNKSISDIADECGFSYAYYMIKKFKVKYGSTPQKYRQKNSETKISRIEKY